MEETAASKAGEFDALSSWLNDFAAKGDGDVDLWWRDDDAVDTTDRLEKLIDISERLQIPVLIAVIPATLKPELVKRLETASPNIIVAQHGYSHENHAVDGKNEFPIDRDVDEIAADILKGRRILEGAFGERFLPVLVAPFNNWPRLWVPKLKELGYFGLSTAGGLQPTASFEMDIHIDLLTWLPTGPVMDAGHIDARTRSWLEQGRKTTSPIGLMTHHLRMKRPGDFERLEAYLTTLRQCRALRFLSPRDAFANQPFRVSM